MAHNVIIKTRTQSFNVDALNRTAIYTTGNLDNGAVVALDAKPAGIGHWTASLPSAGDNGLWIVASPEVTKVDKTHGGSADPRDFENLAGKPFDAFCPQIKDEIEMTGEGISGIGFATSTYLVNTTGGGFVVATAAATAGLVLKKVGTNVLRVGDGAIAPTTVPTYVYEVVHN